MPFPITFRGATQAVIKKHSIPWWVNKVFTFIRFKRNFYKTVRRYGMEEWKTVECNSRYEISNRGRLRSNFGRVKLLQGTLGDGYRKTRMRCGDRIKNVRFHKLMLNAFVGDCPESFESHHIDGDRSNNILENLEYVPKLKHESIKWFGKARVLPKNQGEGNGRSKLTVCDVLVMRGLENLSLSRLAKIFTVSPSHVSSILHRKKWAHVPASVSI